ncbi:Homoserine/homoserine lactone efflux protein [wastewater metagenome]|uniref:Homoserine/homoserine lactone efflux protein n=2 Tax=unclassified sequences TaxID=12908 RepID=A0A5B8RG67_9ZZZZ|nr:LysE family translocator [Arhodomonas sp. KWT]QEA06472.1 homoserine/homoserine lactone efflux protein [uncultured organism]
MIPPGELLVFAAAALVMVLSPGPNMVYLVSRSICQGRAAGMFSLLGVIAGFFLHVLAAAGGLTALFLAIPFAYEVVRWLGAAYLLYLAWRMVRPGAGSPFEARTLPEEGPRRLFLTGFLTNALNPKIAVFYLSVFPQFVSPAYGPLFTQGVLLGLVQIAVSLPVNLAIVLSAATLAGRLRRRPLWLSVQRYVMGFVLGALAVRLVTERRSA